MKKLLLAGIVCLAAFTANAQNNVIKINNTTGCDVYFQLYGDVIGSGCSTFNTYESNIISVPSGGSVAYTPGSVPGGMICTTCSPVVLPANGLIWAAKVYKGYPCAGPNTTTFLLQDNGCTSNPIVSGFTDYDASCTPCSLSTTVKWVNLGTVTTLDFF